MASPVKEVAIAIIERCKHDPKFKKAILTNLYKKLANDENKSHWKAIDKAIIAIERLK